MNKKIVFEEEDLDAVEKSIEHWWNNLDLANGKCLRVEDVEAIKCALCKRNVFCDNCPINIYVNYRNKHGGKYKFDGCSSTPWVKIKLALLKEKCLTHLIKYVINEIEFLYKVRDFVIKRM